MILAALLPVTFGSQGLALVLSVLARRFVGRLQLRSTFADSQFRFVTRPEKGFFRNRSVSEVPQDNMLPGSAFDDARAFSLRSLRSFSITTTMAL